MTITITAPASAFSGFGKTAIELFSRFKEIGIDCKFRPVRLEEKVGGEAIHFPRIIKDHFVKQAEGVELVHTPLLWSHIPSSNNSYIYTMYESTHIPKVYVDALNLYKGVITPTKWNTEVFKRSGVTVPVHVVNLGISSDIFHPTVDKKKPVCTFGAAAWLAPSQKRKNFSALMAAWNEAFSGINNVKLKLKAMPGDKLPEFNDPRIEVCQEFIQAHRLRDWYRSLTAFVSTSRCEGWNLMAHEAMACGVPVITHLNGGHSEYMNRENTFSAWAKLSRHDMVDKSFGYDWEIDPHEVSDAMRFAYSDPDEAKKRGSEAEAMYLMDWDCTVGKMLEALSE